MSSDVAVWECDLTGRMTPALAGESLLSAVRWAADDGQSTQITRDGVTIAWIIPAKPPAGDQK